MEGTEHIHAESLPSQIHGTTGVPRAAPQSDEERRESGVVINEGTGLNYPELKEQFEREFLVKALRAFNGKVNQTAIHTKMTKVTLLRKLEKYGINPREYY